ncbi:DDE-type integrase/transposase/recombinase [Comamonas sp.]|uniref:DDE-type integrase/transposase/recombinase n=1 Tax=Comamonas TaxID=283 RepID=UPI00345B75EE
MGAALPTHWRDLSWSRIYWRSSSRSEHSIPWGTDISFIATPTHEGWLYLHAALDLFSHQVPGCAMGNRLESQCEENAVHIPVCFRRPRRAIIVHCGQGCQCTSLQATSGRIAW